MAPSPYLEACRYSIFIVNSAESGAASMASLSTRSHDQLTTRGQAEKRAQNTGEAERLRRSANTEPFRKRRR
jgi:hypothetical protein